MTPLCADELLHLLMIDDVVLRRKTLDIWTRRWVMTAVLQHSEKLEQRKTLDAMYPGFADKMRGAALADQITNGLLDKQAHAVKFETAESGESLTTTLTLHVLRQEPYET